MCVGGSALGGAGGKTTAKQRKEEEDIDWKKV